MFRGQRGRGVWRVGAVVGALIGSLCLGRALAQDQSPPPPTDVPAQPPTSPPEPPTLAPPPPRADEEEDDLVAPPAPTAEVPTLTPAVTRTRRATRTPRTTATPTPTPVVAGALRATLAQEPAVVVPGAGVTFRLVLLNQDQVPAGDVTIELSLPPELAPGTARADAGQVIAAGSAVRWYLPRLEPGATALLELPANIREVPGAEGRVCVLLLSAASPLEHCIVPRVEAATATPALGLPQGAEPSAGGLAPEGAPRAGPPPELAWLVLLTGLTALGVWLGLRLRGR